VKATCPKCRNVFSLNPHIGATIALPESAPSQLAGVSPHPESGSAGNSSPVTRAAATGGASGHPDILQKYRDFADDYNSGLDRASLCRKYKIHDEKFPSYLEFLKKKGLHLAGPAQIPPSGNPKRVVGKNVPARKRFGLFDRIENREGALKMIRDAAKGFYILGAIQILLGVCRA
jgi:hypothetical protein